MELEKDKLEGFQSSFRQAMGSETDEEKKARLEKERASSAAEYLTKKGPRASSYLARKQGDDT